MQDATRVGYIYAGFMWGVYATLLWLAWNSHRICVDKLFLNDLTGRIHG